MIHIWSHPIKWIWLLTWWLYKLKDLNNSVWGVEFGIWHKAQINRTQWSLHLWIQVRTQLSRCARGLLCTHGIVLFVSCFLFLNFIHKFHLLVLGIIWIHQWRFADVNRFPVLTDGFFSLNCGWHCLFCDEVSSFSSSSFGQCNAGLCQWQCSNQGCPSSKLWKRTFECHCPIFGVSVCRNETWRPRGPPSYLPAHQQSNAQQSTSPAMQIRHVGWQFHTPMFDPNCNCGFASIAQNATKNNMNLQLPHSNRHGCTAFSNCKIHIVFGGVNSRGNMEQGLQRPPTVTNCAQHIHAHVFWRRST